MIVFRFGRWPRQLRGDYEYRRVYLWGLPLPFCRRRPRPRLIDHGKVEIPLVKTVGMVVGGRREKRKEKR